MGALMRAHDWASTPLGHPETWPQSLRTAIRIMLTSRQPIWIGWGKDLTYLYNDPYKSIIGGKHPWALGRPTAVVWREIWDDIGPMLDTAMTGVEGTYVEAQLLIMERNGYPEETYYTFSYSPIPDDDGNPGGIICANTDDTQRVIGERQLVLLRELAARTADARSWKAACERCVQALATDPHDVPFALLYMAEANSNDVSLVSLCGIERDHPAAPERMTVNGPSAWPFGDVLRKHDPHLISGAAAMFDAKLPTGAWQQPPDHAAILPIFPTGETGRSGVLVVGLNPFRLFDEGYRGFLSLAAGQIAAVVGNAQAYEEEQRRAETLAEIDRAKTTFFSNASHEFRTPLSLMLGPLEDMLVRNPTAATIVSERRDLELMHRNGLRLLKLVNTLLDFSRIEAGRIQAVYEPVDLAAYTAELASTFRSAMSRAGLRFTVDCPPLATPIYVDRDMWEKVVLNLVSNAFKYTLDGEVVVAVHAGGNAAELVIRDTGIGIAEAEFPRLFERFHRIEGQKGRSTEGTGIGLALVQELVRLHGGTVQVQSVVGRGTTFTVTVPFGTAHLPADRVGTPPGGPSTSIRAEAFVEEALRWLPGGETGDEAGIERDLLGPRPAAASGAERSIILLADDNADMREYVRRLLAARYEVEAVPDGQEAFEAARRRRPNLILTDVMMPRLDGFGLLRAVRADPDLREVPVVLLSARAGEEAKVEGLEAGADDYLIKPFNARELLARVSTNLDLARARQRAADILREEVRLLETLSRTGAALSSELDLERLVQRVTDAAVELTGAKFGAFFYNIINEQGEAYTLYTLSGAPREAFAQFPMPRNTAVFAPTFRGEGVVRSEDILRDARYGRNPPHNGMPKGHLPVRSYLAVPVVSRSGHVHGGLFFGHPEPSVFTERAELIVVGIAAQAAIAIDNANLYRQSRKAEQELRQFNEMLEQRVTAAIAEREKVEEALRQAQKMEAIGQLTGGVAHDFNNLLQVILGNLETAHRRLNGGELPRPTELTRHIDGAVRGAQRAARLTQQLLAFGRRQPLAPRPIDANKLVGSVSDMLHRVLSEGIRVETVLAAGLWQVNADPSQLESALLNLAVNARDAMSNHGKLTIETANAYIDDGYAATHHDVAAGQYVMICVSDTGTGMSKDILARAFDPFFTTKEVGQGTGLGLSQVYGFVKQSGGHVNIYSEPGEGTTVKLYLPRHRAGGMDAEDSPDVSVPTGKQNEIVLLVEDEEDVRTNARDMLRELGYGVVEAPDGAAALRALERHPQIGLLLTDVGLPGGVNGRQLADEAVRRRPGLKLLFTTGYARNAIVHHGRLDEGIELLPKPFTYAELAMKVRRMLDA